MKRLSLLALVCLLAGLVSIAQADGFLTVRVDLNCLSPQMSPDQGTDNLPITGETLVLSGAEGPVPLVVMVALAESVIPSAARTALAKYLQQ